MKNISIVLSTKGSRFLIKKVATHVLFITISFCSISRSNTHDSVPCSVLYNPLYDVIVSGSNGSTVCVWDVKTGEKKLMFDKAHTAHLYNKEMVGFYLV